MDRAPLKGELGDSVHAVLCRAGYNIRWLLRMIAKKVLFLRRLYSRLCEVTGVWAHWLQISRSIVCAATTGSGRQ
ncbi:MAG: hypothetical protein IPJ36_16890 [Simplicispira sp.]|nr:hypothetical protein [Simplicispira sp.]